MKKGVGVLELLLVLIIIIVGTIMMLKNNPNDNPFESKANLQTKKEQAYQKIDEIEKIKDMNAKIEHNLQEGNE